MKHMLISILASFSVCVSNFCQHNDTVLQIDSIKTTVINGDTVYMANIPAVYIRPPIESIDINELLKYQRLIRNVKKAYPYAILAREKLKEINTGLEKLNSQKEKKAYIDSAEVQLKSQFEEDLKNLTINQGKILIKLIYRETGNTTYYLVKEYKGTFSAIFWQSIARLFGSSLKSKYDPEGEDRNIEEIVIKIQNKEL
jgi:Domain of unknown function (DUF4294)